MTQMYLHYLKFCNKGAWWQFWWTVTCNTLYSTEVCVWWCTLFVFQI